MSSVSFQRHYDRLRITVDRHLHQVLKQHSYGLTASGCKYVLSGGGKRVRAVLTLLSAEAVGGTVRSALQTAAAVEIMHNFTLVHDDIMDHASSRRGKPTVHVRWSTNYALLVGDVLLGLAYCSLQKTRSAHLGRMLDLFTHGLLEVCEGQALDLSYESRSRVTLHDYFRMIEKKTARLFSVATELGALAAGSRPPDVRALGTYGLHLGRAFQIRDDLLDVVADQEELGKTIGGDIIERKRTFLLLAALERTTGSERDFLKGFLAGTQPVTSRTVQHMTRLYHSSGAVAAAREQIQKDTRSARAALRRLPSTPARDTLRWLADYLLHRGS